MTEITTGALARLFDTTAKTIADLAKREIIVAAGKRGHWQLQPSAAMCAIYAQKRRRVAVKPELRRGSD